MNAKDFADALIGNVTKVICGKKREITLITAAMLSRGNVLLEDVPGTGKTVLAKAIAKSIDGGFRRIQFTPDLLPSDVTGINFYNMKNQQFELRKGPVFTDILLADEINRATPRTQSALLECMEERQVTIDGETLPLNGSFLVIATQNPVEIQGTYPLPEAQLDRFLIRLSLGYADKEAEMQVVAGINAAHPLDGISPVLTTAQLDEAADFAAAIKVSDTVTDYIVEIGKATRSHPQIKLGVSTRGLIALKRMAQALAAIDGRSFVTPGDVKAAAPYVLPHRLSVNEYSINRKQDSAAVIIASILDSVPVPTEEI